MNLTDRENRNLRNNEYFNKQVTFDQLYSLSQQGFQFKDLFSEISSESNILLAFRNLKTNTGSRTKGTNGHTIKHLNRMDSKNLVEITQKRLQHYKSHPVRRHMIPKPNGEQRPLGIPTIEDRLIQQMFLQVLDPIVEAKFYPHSYGFRPKRSTHDALARIYHLVNHSYNHHVVDMDIKSFFDNVNHQKLISQLWNLGIRDKRVLSIIKAMLKAEIEGEGVPDKGTPQGGILSPLLSNVVLNDLDWWISNQWDTKPTKFPYKLDKNRRDALRRTNLKPMYIVRYADDFQIFTNSRENAIKIYHATKRWLNERLNLRISEEKSKIVNLRKNGADFLGIRYRAVEKGNGKLGYIVNSKMDPKAKEKVTQVIRYQLQKLRKSPTPEKVMLLNSTILGMHNYYKIATRISIDFNDIRHKLNPNIKSLRFRNIFLPTKETNPVIDKYYSDFNYQRFKSNGILVYPLESIRHQIRGQRKPEFTIYNKEDRKKIYNDIRNVTPMEIEAFRVGNYSSKSTLYENNRLSRYVAQKGTCYIAGERLNPFTAICHHIKPSAKGGTDEYKNLVIINKKYHMLIHNKQPLKVQKHLQVFRTLEDKHIKKLNGLRTEVGNPKLEP